MNILEVNNLSYSYTEDQPVLTDVSLAIEKGSYTSILGHNGSGKSTLAKLIMGLLPNFKGQIIINSSELNQNNLPQIRKDISMVFQNPDNQFIGITVEDDIAFGLENNQTPHEQMAAIVREYASKVGMSEYLAKEPGNLSGGQKQRVAIAGVLALNPKIIIFDEATSMLDPKGRREIYELISEIRKNNPDLTVVSITHDVEEAYESDYVIIMNHGKVRTSGKPQEVMINEEMMAESNLKVPYAIRLGHALNKVGYNIPENSTIEQIGEIVCRSK